MEYISRLSQTMQSESNHYTLLIYIAITFETANLSIYHMALLKFIMFNAFNVNLRELLGYDLIVMLKYKTLYKSTWRDYQIEVSTDTGDC